MSRPQSPARQRFREFLISVAVLHVAAIALFYALDLRHAPASKQRMFAWVWMGATVAVVFIGLGRLRRARLLTKSAPGKGASP